MIRYTFLTQESATVMGDGDPFDFLPAFSEMMDADSLSDEEVIAMGKKASKDMTALFMAIIEILKQDNDR